VRSGFRFPRDLLYDRQPSTNILIAVQKWAAFSFAQSYYDMKVDMGDTRFGDSGAVTK
jgi:hypothetical protein